MTIVDDFQNGVLEAMKFGQQCRIKYYGTGVSGAGSYYDDAVQLVQSGVDYWTSGVVLPISNTRGSSDAILLEQGKVLTQDTKLYVQGSVPTSGTIKIGLGSVTDMSGREYSLLSEGVTKWDVNEVPILKKLFIRHLDTGSLTGEF